jgi:hypothetical protein
LTLLTHDDERIEGVVFTWLPPETKVIISYIGRDEIGKTLLVGRDVISYPSVQGILSGEFPFECQELVLDNMNRFGIQCAPIELALTTDRQPTTYLVFGMEQNIIYNLTVPNDVLIELSPILQKNWVWSPNVGMLLFNSENDNLDEGFYFIPYDTKTIEFIPTNVILPPSDFDLAPDGSRFIYKSAQTDVWSIYNLEQGIPETNVPIELEYTLPIENVQYSAGIQWYTPNEILYATEGSNPDESRLIIQSLDGEQRTYDISGTIISIYVLHQ